MIAAIDEGAEVVAAETASAIRAVRPRAGDILRVQQQLLKRHADLKLKAVVSAEEIVEGLLRCHVADHLARRFQIPAEALPHCMNASHKAVRRVCAAPRQHHHLPIPDEAWTKGWLDMQTRFP
jgi:hypothetical protein